MTRLKVILFFCFSTFANAEQITVGLEPFPPLINEDGSGILISLLKQIATETEFEFTFELMTYARAKRELENTRIDLIGLTPQHNETNDFYQYAEELNWSINTNLDLFTMRQPPVALDKFADFTIGTLRGNAEFFSQILKIKQEKFIEVSALAQLVKMLKKGRIKAIIFERISTMLTIKQLKAEGIYYQKLTSIAASFAVQNNNAGRKLKTKLDEQLTQSSFILQDDTLKHYNNLAIHGKISLNNLLP